MQYYAELVYGFDFSNQTYPRNNFELVDEIVEELEKEEILTTVYSGYGDSLLYLGEKLAEFNDGDCMFSACDEFNKKFDNNIQLYNEKIGNKIDVVIEWLNTSGMEKAKDGEFIIADVTSAIDYFIQLKTMDPEKLTISGTD